MPRIALEAGSRLVIVNQEDTPFDSACHLRFREGAGEVLPQAVAALKKIAGL